ncbi:CDP-glycerol glycerophosphotransferase family protein [Enterobacter kobei]|uniref:CDP-glycerol glycerophosphotransferase family protein n=1 Tax=Enterobacter kobei TaxID=208224 RepID=UPI0026F24AA3|nr:CDP-glycerol glycerophosphotransferase family protein [Enterobacter kobei]
MTYIAELFYICINTILSFLSLMKKINKKKIIITSTHNVSFNFNSKYIFEYFIESDDWKGYEIYYVINDEKKRKELNKRYKKNYFIESKSFVGAFFCLDAVCWISSTFELPVNSFFRDPRRSVLHLGHGVPLKKIGLNEENISFIKKINRKIRTRQFTDVISYSEFLKDNMVKTFANVKANYLYLGQPRNDNLSSDGKNIRRVLSNISGATSDAQFILYAPTWRPYDTTLFFPFNINIQKLDKILNSTNTYIFIRSHPFYPSNLSEEIESLPHIVKFNSDIAPEICDYLFGFDGLITDYSSIYIDYLVTDNKIAFIPYDYSIYKANVGFCYPYNEFTPGCKIYNEVDLECFILSDGVEYQNARLKIRTITNTKPSGNCFEVANYIKQLCISRR